MRGLIATDLDRLRHAVVDASCEAGMEPDRAERLALAVSEIATNAIRYAGGVTSATVWAEGGRILVEIEDDGPGIPAHVTAVRPEPDATRGRGLWLVNQLCDGVDLRTGRSGTRVRLIMAVSGPWSRPGPLP